MFVMCQLDYLGCNIRVILISLFIFGVNACSSPKAELKLAVYEYDFGLLQSDSVYNGTVVIENVGRGTRNTECFNRLWLYDCTCNQRQYIAG